MYYGGPEKEPHWWSEVWVLTQAVFSVMFWPILWMIASLLGVVGMIWLFVVHPLLGLAAMVALGVAIWAFARWYSARHEPPLI